MRSVVLAGVLLGAWAVGCKQAEVPPEVTCGAVLPESEALLVPGATLLLGEVHGTREIPRQIGDLVCQAARRGLSVTLGLEHSHAGDAALEAWLSSTGSAEDRAKLLSGTDWQTPWPDGRTSQAMFELLDRLRTFRQRGWRVHAFGVNGGEARDAAGDGGMAYNVRVARAARPDDVFLVLTGDNHTRVDADLAMGGQLRLAGVPVTTVRFSYAGGTFWTCWGPTCGVRELGGGREDGVPGWRLTSVPSPGPGPGWVLFSSPVAYHASLYVGRVSASPPVTRREDVSSPEARAR